MTSLDPRETSDPHESERALGTGLVECCAFRPRNTTGAGRVARFDRNPVTNLNRSVTHQHLRRHLGGDSNGGDEVTVAGNPAAASGAIETSSVEGSCELGPHAGIAIMQNRNPRPPTALNTNGVEPKLVAAMDSESLS